MSYKQDYNRNDYVDQAQGDAAKLAEISFINKVYGLMTMGLLTSAIIARLLYLNTTLQERAGMMLPCLIAELVLVLVLSWAGLKLPPIVAIFAFFGYAALNGITLSCIFDVYKLGSILQIFFATAGMFGAMCIYGVTTKRDLTSIGNLCIMALIGIIIASLINFFLRSTGLEFVLSILGVLAFTGLTAFDAQKIMQIQKSGHNHTGLAVLGALTLYLDFINMFLYLLRLFGRRK